MNLGCEVGLEAETLHLGTTKLLKLGTLALVVATKLTLGKFLPCKSEPVKPKPFPVRVLRVSFSVPLSITEPIELNQSTKSHRQVSSIEVKFALHGELLS